MKAGIQVYGAYARLAITGGQVRSLMRKHGHTIASVARDYSLTQKRVREVRADGARRQIAADWLFMLTGRWPEQPSSA